MKEVMQTFKKLATSPVFVFLAGAALALVVVWPFMGSAQDKLDKEKMGKGAKNAGGMADLKDVTKPQKSSALPAFPGAVEIYHIGAFGFFIDLSDHIKLTTEQQTTLNSLKEKALLEKSTSDRKIDGAEQKLWTLTASDIPDATKIDTAVRDIEKLRGDQRLAFIRTVGEAAQVLTAEQRQVLLDKPKPDAQKDHQPPALPAGSPPPGVDKIAPPDPEKATATPVQQIGDL